MYIATDGNGIWKFPYNSTSSTTGVKIASAGIGRAWGIALDKSDNIYVADNSSSSIKMFPPNTTITTVPKTVAIGNGSNQLSNTRDLFIDKDGAIFVADLGNNRIQKFPAGSDATTSGITVAGGNGAGNAANQLNSPVSMCTDLQGNLYVADAGNNRIQKFPAGSTSTTNGTTIGTVNSMESNHTKIYVDSRGYIYISGTAGVYRFPPNAIASSTGLKLTSTAVNGDRAQMGSVLIDSLGYIYNTEYYNQKLYKWRQNFAATSYKPTVAGNYTASVTSYVGCPSLPSNTVVIGSPILVQPSLASQTLCTGANGATISVLTTGSGLTYQWYKNTIQSLSLIHI